MFRLRWLCALFGCRGRMMLVFTRMPRCDGRLDRVQRCRRSAQGVRASRLVKPVQVNNQRRAPIRPSVLGVMFVTVAFPVRPMELMKVLGVGACARAFKVVESLNQRSDSKDAIVVVDHGMEPAETGTPLSFLAPLARFPHGTACAPV